MRDQPDLLRLLRSREDHRPEVEQVFVRQVRGQRHVQKRLGHVAVHRRQDVEDQRGALPDLRRARIKPPEDLGDGALVVRPIIPAQGGEGRLEQARTIDETVPDGSADGGCDRPFHFREGGPIGQGVGVGQGGGEQSGHLTGARQTVAEGEVRAEGIGRRCSPCGFSRPDRHHREGQPVGRPLTGIGVHVRGGEGRGPSPRVGLRQWHGQVVGSDGGADQARHLAEAALGRAAEGRRRSQPDEHLRPALTPPDQRVRTGLDASDVTPQELPTPLAVLGGLLRGLAQGEREQQLDDPGMAPPVEVRGLPRLRATTAAIPPRRIREVVLVQPREDIAQARPIAALHESVEGVDLHVVKRRARHRLLPRLSFRVCRGRLRIPTHRQRAVGRANPQLPHGVQQGSGRGDRLAATTLLGQRPDGLGER